VQIHPFLTLALVEVSLQLYAPAALPTKKEPLVPTGEAVWSLESVWTLGKRKSSCPCQQ